MTHNSLPRPWSIGAMVEPAAPKSDSSGQFGVGYETFFIAVTVMTLAPSFSATSPVASIGTANSSPSTIFAFLFST